MNTAEYEKGYADGRLGRNYESDEIEYLRGYDDGIEDLADASTPTPEPGY